VTESPDDLLALERQVCFALVVASRSVVAAYKPILDPLGLTHPQYLVMLALWERSPRSLGDLSETLVLEPATLSPLIKRLEAAGLVERRRNPLDERSLVISLTAEGRALRTRALAVPGRVMERLGLGVDELAHARDVLDGLIRAAQEPPQ